MKTQWLNRIALTFVCATTLFAGNAMAGSNYKLKITNTFPDVIKVKWYCDGKKMDADTFPAWRTKTRELSDKKCSSTSKLTIKIYSGAYGYRVAMNGYFGPNAYANVAHLNTADLDKAFLKSSLLTEIKFDKIPSSSNGGKKRCIAIAPDSTWAALFGAGSLATPAFYPKNC
ncbi:MAG: hypothetical protein MJK04_01835 [Psychrosphaera sp.]|nr:hypothetical protein [Psychrosphaera sp.]